MALELPFRQNSHPFIKTIAAQVVMSEWNVTLEAHIDLLNVLLIP
jgi:hypothetical protein